MRACRRVEARVMTPRSLAVLRAIARLEDAGRRATANPIAREAAREDAAILDRARRLGNGAVKGSWSGSMADCQRILGSLGALRREGLIRPVYERGRATRYAVTPEGRNAAADA